MHQASDEVYNSAFFHNIQLDLQGIAPLPAYVGFTDGLNQWGVGLLGQSGFFDRVGVHFDLHNGKLEIEICSAPL
jgi:hypothetical protein